MKYLDLIVSILSGAAVCLPLAAKLVQYAACAVREKNWTKLMSLVMRYMTEEELRFTDGSTRRDWVIAMVKASGEELNYDVDAETVGRMVDKLCSMSKTVNAPAAAVY